MKYLPIGVQTFSKMINGNYIYVDKTREIFNLFAEGGEYYFLSRPRRFGKSLLISTLKEIFSGNKELFKDLWLYDQTQIDWKSHPVIHIDFTGLNYKTPQRLEETLGRLLDDIAAAYDVSLDPKRYHNEKFKQLIETLANSRKTRVVVLIDEYDNPITDKLEKEENEIAVSNRDILREFYGVLKNVDQHIRFVFITGVSKFSRISLFSGLNNLNDITLDDQHATLLGYTEEELCRYFPLENENNPKEETLENIRKWYNGYSWDGKNFVYNPTSILYYFKKNRFANYWFATGTPKFLIKLIKEKEFPIREFENIEADDTTFDSFDIDHMSITSLLFQTGYLTVKKKTIDPEDEETTYHLSYPNKEVKDSFLKHLLKGFSQKEFTQKRKVLKKLKLSLEQKNLDDFFGIIKSFLASIPYNIFVDKREGYYHTILYLLLTLSGVSVLPEPETNIGRIDALVEMERTIYIMELKIGTPEEALNQIKEKKYYEPYLNSGKAIVMVGVGIDPSIRNITDYISELHN